MMITTILYITMTFDNSEDDYEFDVATVALIISQLNTFQDVKKMTLNLNTSGDARYICHSLNFIFYIMYNFTQW